MVEKRKNKRFTFVAEAVYGYDGKIVDISVDGAFIETLNPLPEKSLIKVRFKTTQGKELILKAIVKNTMKGRGMGIEFVSLNNEDCKAFADFINTCG
jgi:hypothetical protein